MPASNSAADLNAVREGDGKWTRWFSDPIYGRGYPADVVADFERQDAMPNSMNFIMNGDMKVISISAGFSGSQLLQPGGCPLRRIRQRTTGFIFQAQDP